MYTSEPNTDPVSIILSDILPSATFVERFFFPSLLLMLQ